MDQFLHLTTSQLLHPLRTAQEPLEAVDQKQLILWMGFDGLELVTLQRLGVVAVLPHM